MRHLFVLAIMGIILMVPAMGQESTEIQQPQIEAHNLRITLNPELHTIGAADSVRLTEPVTGEFRFTLNKNLLVESLMADSETPVEWTLEPYEDEGSDEEEVTETFQWIVATFPAETQEFEIVYSGEIYDPIDPSSALGRVRGDYTTGIISEEGVYLSSGSGWYPDTEYSMAMYNVMVTVPESWSAVTQGSISFEHESSPFKIVSWDCDGVPSDGCVLVANEYHVRSREIDGVTCSTYFYQDDEELSNQFLDKLEEYLPAYQELFGPLPYPRFDIVENFFTTGYGMPGFTLLGSRVLRMPYATAEGSLAHELVHNWWGNYVYVDWETGNWCEGLTYFSTNYYWNILDGRPEDAEHFRFRAMVKYSVEVSPEEDYPVREFLTKWTAEDGDIGYDKSGAIFVMLLEMLGEEKFFEACRLAVERYGGKQTSWDDWRDVFTELAERDAVESSSNPQETCGSMTHDIAQFFTTWLDNNGTPDLLLQNVTTQQVDEGYELSFQIRQEGEPFYFNLPIYLNLRDAEGSTQCTMMAQAQQMTIRTSFEQLAFQLDPDYYVFRRLSRDEIPPSLNVTMEGDSVLVVLPSGGENDTLQTMSMMGGGMSEVSVKAHYEGLAQSIAQGQENVIVKYDNEVTEEDLANNSILCFGAARYNSLTARLGAVISGDVTIGDSGFSVAGTEYTGEGIALLATVRNPYNPDRDITFYLGNSPQAVSRAAMIFFYGWDSYIVYENGSPIDRGEWDMGEGPLYYEF